MIPSFLGWVAPCYLTHQQPSQAMESLHGVREPTKAVVTRRERKRSVSPVVFRRRSFGYVITLAVIKRTISSDRADDKEMREMLRRWRRQSVDRNMVSQSWCRRNWRSANFRGRDCSSIGTFKLEPPKEIKSVHTCPLIQHHLPLEWSSRSLLCSCFVSCQSQSKTSQISKCLSRCVLKKTIFSDPCDPKWTQ